MSEWTTAHWAPLCWLAGHFEGEGTISITRSKAKHYVYTRPHVSLTSTDPEVPAMFYARWGGRLNWYQPKRGNARPALRWFLDTIPTTRSFLLEMLPHFRTERVRGKAELLLADVNERKQGKHGDELAAYRQQRAERMAEMRVLNKRGRV